MGLNHIENKLIFKDKKLSKIDSHILGISGENEQEILVFSFEDGFVDGTCYLELILPNDEKGFIELEKDADNKCYKLLVKNSLLSQEGAVKMQLKIIQSREVWKSKDFEMHVFYAINATETIKEDYPDFVSVANQRLDTLEKNIEDKADKTYVDNAIKSIEILEESDPTVPSWAKQPQKPSYTPQEVGALPVNTKIPSKTSDLENDSNFVEDEDYTHTDNNFTNEAKIKLDDLKNYDEDIIALKEENEILKNQIPNRTSRRREHNVRG